MPPPKDELDSARFLREKQEYLDARAAYDKVLESASSGLPIPYSFKSNYGSANTSGPQRAATDPAAGQQHPEVATAAKRLVREESEFRALDEPISGHPQKNCSHADYIGKKFYEYVAMAEMLYKLATDAKFRKQIVGQLGEAASSGGWLSDIIVMSNPPQPGFNESNESYKKRIEARRGASERTR